MDALTTFSRVVSEATSLLGESGFAPALGNGIRELIETNLPNARLSGAIAKAGVPKGYAPATQFAVEAE